MTKVTIWMANVLANALSEVDLVVAISSNLIFANSD
jgi:hypothetical protein